MNRVVCYIDGFNLYHGLRDRSGHRFLWLDLQALAERLLHPGQELVAVKYFTAPVRNDPPALARQNAYLGALRTRAKLQVELGRFQQQLRKCHQCGATWRTYEEKQTDVAIAVTILEDGANNLFDTALLLSADSDLCPALFSLKRLQPDKRTVIAFPPRRHSDALRRAAHTNFTVGVAVIRQCLLPAVVTDPTGSRYERPAKWA